MNFLEAAEIAKQNPGAVVSRSESGLFFVRLKDGRIVSSPYPPESANGQQTELSKLESLVLSQTRSIETANAEIRQLRLEVNNLKAAVAKIPSTEWSRFEGEQRKLEEQRRAAEADRLVALARSGQLTFEQLNLVADNASALGISAGDYAFLREEIFRKRSPVHISAPNIVSSTTDGE